MMKRFVMWVLMMCVLPIIALAQQIDVKARVVDEAGKAMPYANIYIEGRKCVLTDNEGKFSIRIDANAKVKIFCVGYETMNMKASDIRRTIRMKGLSVGEVVVLSDYGILKKVAEKLAADYKANRNRETHYFNRMTMVCDWETEMVENLISAKSAVNLRDMKLVSGRYWAKAMNGTDVQSSLGIVGMARTMAIGAQVYECPIWEENLIMPLMVIDSPKELKKKFVIKKETLTDSDGRLIYRFTFDTKKKRESYINVSITSTRMRLVSVDEPSPVTGQLYVDAETFGVLKYNAKAEGLNFILYKTAMDVDFTADMDVNINYTQRNGYAEIADMNVFLGKGQVLYRSSLVNVEEYAKGAGEGQLIGKNMIETINAMGCDEALMAKCNIIQRNEEEQMLSMTAARTLEEQKADTLKYPHERIYLTLDNTSYCKGEMMWFKAFVARNDGLRYKDLSRILYVDLVDPEGKVVTNTKFPLRHFESSGQIKLADSLMAGVYQLKAYTRYTKNWGDDGILVKNVRIDPIVFSEKRNNKKLPVAELDMSTLSMDRIPAANQVKITNMSTKIQPDKLVTFTLHADPFSHLALSCIDLSQMMDNMSGDDVVTFMSQPDALPAEPTASVIREPESTLRTDSVYMAENADLLGGPLNISLTPSHSAMTDDMNIGLRQTKYSSNYRRTLLWKSSLITDYKGEATVTFRNNSKCKRLLIKVDGVTKDGRFLALRKVLE